MIDETQLLTESSELDPLFLVGEALRDRELANETVDFAALANELGVEVQDVQDCHGALYALANAFIEEQDFFLDDVSDDIEEPQLPSDYEILGELGRGGMGIVYHARQNSLDREVAVKILRPGDMQFGSLIQRFERESKALAKLRHPHIVSVYQVGRVGDHVFFTMDYVKGAPLSELMLRSGPLSPSHAVRLLKELTSAVAYIHSQSLLHRDLKPSNVLLDEDGQVFLVDFGLVQDMSSKERLTLTGNILGTPAYMSPEQARGDLASMGEASDVYALGAILYEALTNTRPFSKPSIGETLSAVINSDPEPLRKLNKSIPVDLETICLKALAKPLEQRYANATAFLRDLEAFEQGEPILARRPSYFQRLRSWTRRNAMKTLLAGQVLVLLIVSIGFGRYYFQQQQAESDRQEAEEKKRHEQQRMEEENRLQLARKELELRKEEHKRNSRSRWSIEAMYLKDDKKAAALGDARAKCHLGEALIHGIGIEKDPDRGFALLAESINDNYKPAQTAYHRALRGLIEDDIDKFLSYDAFSPQPLSERHPELWQREKARLLTAAKNGQRWALLILALFHRDGALGFEQSAEKSAAYFVRAASAPGPSWWAEKTRMQRDWRVGVTKTRLGRVSGIPGLDGQTFFDIHELPLLIKLAYTRDKDFYSSLIPGLQTAASKRKPGALITLLAMNDKYVPPREKLEYAFWALELGIPSIYWNFDALLNGTSASVSKKTGALFAKRILLFEKSGNPVEKGLLAWCYEDGRCGIPSNPKRGKAIISELTQMAHSGDKWASRTLTHYYASYVKDEQAFLKSWILSIRLGSLNIGHPEEALRSFTLTEDAFFKSVPVIQELEDLARSGNLEAKQFLLAVYSHGLFGERQSLTRAKAWRTQ